MLVGHSLISQGSFTQCEKHRNDRYSMNLVCSASFYFESTSKLTYETRRSANPPSHQKSFFLKVYTICISPPFVDCYTSVELIIWPSQFWLKSPMLLNLQFSHPSLHPLKYSDYWDAKLTQHILMGKPCASVK